MKIKFNNEDEVKAWLKDYPGVVLQHDEAITGDPDDHGCSYDAIKRVFRYWSCKVEHSDLNAYAQDGHVIEYPYEYKVAAWSPVKPDFIDDGYIPEPDIDAKPPALQGIKKHGELPYQLVPPEWDAQLAFIAARGGIKYAPYDWEKGLKDLTFADRLDSISRHLKKFFAGEDTDDETQAHHMGQVAFNALMVYSMQVRKEGVDNRRTSILCQETNDRIREELDRLTALLKEPLK